MRSKILVCLFCILLSPVAGVFADVPDFTTPEAVASVEAGGACATEAASPLEGAIFAATCAQLACSYDLQCNNICGPGYCGGKCQLNAGCPYKTCRCLFCP